MSDVQCFQVASIWRHSGRLEIKFSCKSRPAALRCGVSQKTPDTATGNFQLTSRIFISPKMCRLCYHNLKLRRPRGLRRKILIWRVNWPCWDSSWPSGTGRLRRWRGSWSTASPGVSTASVTSPPRHRQPPSWGPSRGLSHGTSPASPSWGTSTICNSYTIFHSHSSHLLIYI